MVVTAEDFPGDIGSVVALLLNPVRLAPGEAIFLDAGNVHAYLRGTGVEIMANSDNVLRSGLTHKHLDVPELLRIADFTELVEPRCAWRDEGGGLRRFLTPARDFELTIVSVGGKAGGPTPWLTRPSDQILLCTAGPVVVTSPDGELGLGSGRAVFVPAGLPVRCTGPGTVFRATTPARSA